TALATLDSGQLQRIFSSYWTINTNLQTYLRWRIQNDPSPGSGAEPVDLQALPCAFRPATTPPRRLTLPPGSSEEIQQVIPATLFLESRTDRQMEGAVLMESLLRRRQPRSDWSAPYYAALATRISLANGDSERARRILELGLKVEPHD